MNYAVYETQQNYVIDNRFKPRVRKHPELWQYYLVIQELTEMRKKHNLRIKSIKRGVSNLNDEIEQDFIDRFELDLHLNPKNKKEREISIFQVLVEEGQKVGPIWEWITDHKGIGPSLAAKTLALIDDIEKFNTISKLWRYAGYGISEYWCDKDGKVVCPKEGWKWMGPKDKRYRVWTICQSDNETHESHATNSNGNSYLTDETQLSHAIPIEKQWAIPQNNTLPLIQRVDFIEPKPDWQLKKLSDRLCKSYHAPYCTPLKSTLHLIADSFMKSKATPYADMYYFEREKYDKLHPKKTKKHRQFMAMRKVKKEFLKQLWLNWRQFEGLPISEGY